jgi:hypothetical protein
MVGGKNSAESSRSLPIKQVKPLVGQSVSIMVSTSIVLAFILQGPEALNVKHFYRGASEPSAYLRRYLRIPRIWTKSEKQRFIEQLFEASKTIDIWEKNKVPGDLGGREIAETYELYRVLVQNFSLLKGGGSEDTQVRTLTSKLRPAFQEMYLRAKPFKQSATYRKVFPSPVHYLAYYQLSHPHLGRKWLENELKVGAAWEAKRPEFNHRLLRDGSMIKEFRRIYPNANLKEDTLGYSASEMYKSLVRK